MSEIQLTLDRDLNPLITELEAEKNNLLRLIDGAVKEHEFMAAHFHQEALDHVEKQLRTLKNLADETYDRRQFLQDYIYRLGLRKEHDRLDGIKALIDKQIRDAKEELRALEQMPKRNAALKPNHLPEYLKQLARKEIKGLKIVLNRQENLLIEIRGIKHGVRLIIPDISSLEREYVLSEDRLLKLRGLGFSFNDRADKLTMELSGAIEQPVEKIMRLISIIVFEVFYFKEFGKESAIELLT